MDAPGSMWQSDGDVIYRTDAVGERVGVFPATCRRGEHSLDNVGYRAHDTGEGFLQISCNACFQETPPRYDHYWVLRLSGPAPARAEIDDQPYLNLLRAVQLS
ncbi:hypothetical protein [Actinocrispum wychmicini]|uniref:Uncharacterized protein n=1 Tax=Actinocrispum wychmicini TaxID=1213861 RepID=A0A4R2K3D4_9PSEU|nr:hypothetical protein [Actinocrispum wychmicini]TCO60825.1 hypothetical protein EV192_103406 [Actinocrispum wychmicini]